MGMWTTENQDTLNLVLRQFSDAARENYGSHSFESGYLQSVLISVVPLLPKRAQKELINDMIRAAQKQEAEVIAKMQKDPSVDRAFV